MKGYLSFLILWILSKKSLKDAEVVRELEKRRRTKPSPSTIYPALKELFCRIFYDMEEISEFCKNS